MTLNQLRYFCTAARYHSISQAARVLFVTQPTVSIAIRDLEKEFAVTLFNYTKNRLELTRDGEQFYEKASYLLRFSDDMHSEFADRRHFQTNLKIGIPPMLGTIFFPDMYNAFSEKYPTVNLEMEEYGSARACRLVQDEVLDVALVNMELYDIDKFNSLILMKEQLMFCVEKNHRLANRQSVTINDLKDEKLVFLNSDSVTNSIIQLRFDAFHILPEVVLRSSQILTTLGFVRGNGCGCFMFSNQLPQFEDIAGIPVDPPIMTNVGLVWKKGRYIVDGMQDFIDFCAQYSADHIKKTEE